MSIIKRIKGDSRGAALVYVIVTVAIILLLGAATVTAAYANLRATQIQEQSDNNFYSADSIMNAIVGGLENDMSRAYEIAYTKIITNLNSYENTEDIKDEFNETFLNELNSILNDGSNSFSSFYSVSHIQSYAQDVFDKNINYTISALNGNNYIDIIGNGIVLRNLHVTYENDIGYYDEIATDVKLTVPDFSPSLIPQPNDEITLNAFIVDDGLEVGFNKELQINGDVYIGERESDRNVILLNTNSNLHIIAPNEVIAGGLIKTEENSKLTIIGDGDKENSISIWTENFDFGRYSNIDISGHLFVFDDMEINGAYSNVRLSGEYYGYNKSKENVNESSAININGAHATLDIQKLDMLVLAGSSYIKASELESGNNNYNNNLNLQLGEAISVKSNQIAYLVDDKEFSQSDIKDFVSNPMSYTQYETLIQNNGGWDATASILSNKELSYGKSYREYGASIVPIFSSKDGGTVYLYLSFKETDNAAIFFRTVYYGNSLLSQRLRTYAAQYITSLRLNTNANLLVNENYIDQSIGLYTEESIKNMLDGLGYDQTKPDQISMDNILTQIKSDYLDNGEIDGNGEKYKVMYSKLVNSEKMKEFIQNAQSANTYTDHNTDDKIEIVENGVIISGTTGSKAIIIDNAGKEKYILNSGSGIVIVSGDIEIAGDWLGTIIVGGRAYCSKELGTNSHNVTSDRKVVENVLPLYFSWKEGNVEKSMSVVNIFNGYENVGVNNATKDDGINSDMISSCVEFTNWNRY